MEIFSSELERVEDDRYKSDFDIFSLLEYEKSVLDIY